VNKQVVLHTLAAVEILAVEIPAVGNLAVGNLTVDLVDNWPVVVDSPILDN